MHQRFQGRTILVSGAAGGVGFAASSAFAREGGNVVLVDVQRDKVEEAASAIRRDGGVACAFTADVSQAAGCEAMVAEALARFGALHVAVNNAGVPSAPYGSFVDASAADWERVIAVNLTGPFHAMKAEARALRAAGGGAIVNVASMMSFGAQPGMASYIASKHGLAGLTKAVAMDLVTQGIRVNAVCPGFIDTPMLAPALETASQVDAIQRLVPQGRIASPDEIAKVILFLASEEASYMVGSLVRVDGGATLA